MTERCARSEWTEVDGRRVFYRRLPGGPEASAPPLLLIHGISCCTGTWAPLVHALSRQPEAPEVLVPDLPAHGRSEPPARLLGMEEYAAWALRFLDAAGGAARVDVMGHSMGCQVALALAQKHPERVRRIVLLGATTGARHVSTLRNLAGLMGDSLREPLSYNLLLARVFWRMGPLRYLLTVREMQRDDAFRRAAAVAAPALVLQGARDLIVPKHVAEGLAKALPCAAYARVPGAAHAAQYSHPEETAALVLRFLVE